MESIRHHNRIPKNTRNNKKMKKLIANIKFEAFERTNYPQQRTIEGKIKRVVSREEQLNILYNMKFKKKTIIDN